MQPIGLLIDFKDGHAKQANLGMATAAQGPGRELLALVVDAPAAETQAVLEAHGVSRIVNIRTNGSAWDPAKQAAAVVAAMHKFAVTNLIGLTSPAGRELLPRIAARLDAPLIMDCTEIDLATHTVKTSQYSGKTIATITMTGSHFIYGMRANVVDPVADPVASKVVDFVFNMDTDAAYRVIDTRINGSSNHDLAESDVIISGGRGLKNAENFKLLFDCAKPINAAVGASRVAVDNGWVPYAMQVGQTGVKVNPKVYIAVGISGSVQHFAGMKTAKTIIAINTDADAAIMANCDHYAIGDLFDILPALEKALSAVKK